MQWAYLRMLAQKILDRDAKVHSYFMGRFPRVVEITDSVLEGIFYVLTHAAFALIGALLLTVLVLTDKISVIVAVCIGLSWLVAFTWIARANPIRKLMVLSRLTAVTGAGIILATAALWLGNWAIAAKQKSAAQNAAHVDAIDEIKQLDVLFAGREEVDLTQFFAFDQMLDLNMRMYSARIKHFQQTGQQAFDITPYAANQSLSIDTSVAGSHLTRQPNGQILYDFDPGQIAMIVLPQKYSDNKKLLVNYENSTTLASSVIISVKDFDNTLEENVSLLIKVMDAALKESPDYFVRYDDMSSSVYFNAVSNRYWSQFRDLRRKADKIRDACRSELSVH
jgi:hypothetical protein